MSRKQRGHISSIYRKQRKKENRKSYEAIQLHLLKFPNFPQIVPLTGDHVLKYMSLWGHCSFKAPRGVKVSIKKLSGYLRLFCCLSACVRVGETTQELRALTEN